MSTPTPTPTPTATPLNFESMDMNTTATPAISAPVTTGFDFNALRLPANYSAGLGVKKVLNKVPVGKPDKTKFFRVNRGGAWIFPTFIYEDKDAKEIYIVPPFMQPLMGTLARPAQLHAAIDRSDNPFLIPVYLPGEDGKWNSWHESLAQGVEMAIDHWVRLTANMSIKANDINQATAALPDPVWPATTMEELVKVAFRGKIIDSPAHPVIRALQGAV